MIQCYLIAYSVKHNLPTMLGHESYRYNYVQL